MKNYIQPGMVVTVPAPAGGVVSGAGVRIGVLFGVAQATAAATVPVEIATHGVFTLPKTSAQAWTVGAAIYWDPTNNVATTATTTGNLFIGCAGAAAINPSATGVVILNGSCPTAVT